MITLTGDIEGLLRHGSPVRKHWNDWSANGFYLEELEPDIAGRRCRCWFDKARIGLDVGFPPELILTEPVGFTHALWWLTANIQHASGALLTWDEGVRWHLSHRGYWELYALRVDDTKRWQEVNFLPWFGDDAISDGISPVNSVWCRYVPALGQLDPAHPNYREIALRTVCLHTAGLLP